MKLIFGEIFRTKAFALFLLLMISGWIHLLGHSVDEFRHISLSSFGKGVQVSVYFLAFIGVFFNASNAVALLKKNQNFLLLLAIALVSVLWTDNFIFTATRLVGVVGLVCIVLVIATQFSVEAFLRWIVWFYLFLVIVNYAAIYFFPEISLTRENNYSSPWVGFFHQKNLLAQAMVIFMVISYIQLLTRNISWLTFFFIVIVTAPLVYYSESMTANVLLLAGFFSSTFIRLYFKYRFSLHWFLLSLLLIMLSVYFFKSDLLSLVGKSETLTGRTITWGFVYEQAKMMPLFGHGYGSWLDYQLIPKKYDHLISLGGHNGYLDIMFWFGWFGVSVFTFFIVDMARKIYVLLNNTNDSSLLFLSVFFIIFILANITESLVLVRSGLTWTLFVFVVFKTNEKYYEYLKDKFKHEVNAG